MRAAAARYITKQAIPAALHAQNHSDVQTADLRCLTSKLLIVAARRCKDGEATTRPGSPERSRHAHVPT